MTSLYKPLIISMDRRYLKRRRRMKQKERRRNQGIFTDSLWSTRSKKFVENFRLNRILFSHLTNLSGSGCMWGLCWGHLYFNRYRIIGYTLIGIWMGLFELKQIIFGSLISLHHANGKSDKIKGNLAPLSKPLVLWLFDYL